jgi:hypothetical protein
MFQEGGSLSIRGGVEEMNLLPLEKLGARCTPNGVADFGVFFPWISEANGNSISVKIIHEKDQFLQDVPPKVFKMEHQSIRNMGTIGLPR